MLLYVKVKLNREFRPEVLLAQNSKTSCNLKYVWKWPATGFGTSYKCKKINIFEFFLFGNF